MSPRAVIYARYSSENQREASLEDQIRTPPSVVNARLHQLDARRLQLEAELSTAAAPAPRLHPNMAELYLQKVAAQARSLAEDDDAEIRALLRELVEAVVLVPEEGRLRVEIRGELAAILALGSGAANGKHFGDAGALVEQVKMVAGKRNHRELTPICVAC